MSRESTPSEALRLRLMAHGVQSAQELARGLGVSQPTVSRQLAALGVAIERIGGGPSTRYALRRSVRGGGSQWPVYRVDAGGRIELLGLLNSLHGGFRIQFEAGAVPRWIPRDFSRFGLFPGLPFFLQDIRPQGFLGRAIARACSDSLMVPSDIRNWSDDDALAYFLSRGDDLPGDLFVGDATARRVTQLQAQLGGIAAGDRGLAYPEYAGQAERGEVAGSSAGGEQPKFAVTVRETSGAVRHVLVKFTTAEPSAVRDRWGDLLICEHLALQTLRPQLGVDASESSLLEFSGRRFLEVTRFDRVGATGRCGVLSLGAILDANSFELAGEEWGDVALAMSGAGLLDTEDARTVRRIWCFGRCIGNNDMHRANFSFLSRDDGPFGLAPVYDMLPMAYAPSRQGIIPGKPLPPPVAVPRFREDWEYARAAARVFWGLVREHPLVSPAFRTIADDVLAAR
jgi:DNA-binding transcriptional ArsR family regulator